MSKRVISAIMVFAMVVGMFAGIMPVNQVSASTEDGLIAWYKFDQVNNNIVTDASGKGNNAALTGSAVVVDDTLRGKAANLDGSSGTYIRLPKGLLNGLTDVSVSTWVYVNKTSGYDRIFDFGANDSNYMYMITAGGNDNAKGLAGALTNGGWSKEQTVATTVGTDIPTGEWKHVAFVFSGANKTGTVYVNGKKFAENTAIAATLAGLNDGDNNYIGKSGLSWEPDKVSNLKVSDFRVYGRTLSNAEVTAIFNPNADNDDANVAADAAELDLGDTTAIKSDIKLPVEGSMGSTITWSSNNTAVIANDGKVTRPTAAQGNATVTLTATISKGTATPVTKTFACTVIADLTEQQKAEADRDVINIGDISSVTDNLTLPATGSYGSTITWSSSNTAVVGNDGTVTRPAKGQPNATATLTATIKNGTTGSTTKVFNLTVLAMPAVDNLVAWYKFDQISGTTVTDASGNGKNATLSSSTMTVTDGAIKASAGTKGINLSGTDYVTLPQGIVSGSDEMTVSTWVLVSKAQDYQRIFDFGTDSSVNMFMMPQGGGRGYAFAINGGSGETTLNTTKNLPTGTWQHVAVSIGKDLATTGKYVIKLYLNGVIVKQVNGASLSPKSLGNTTNNWIGKSQYADPLLRGSVCDFRVYSKALSDNEVVALSGVTDADCIANDRDSIYIGNVFTIDSNLTLPTKGSMGSTITWASSNPGIIETNGTVHRPAAGQPDAKVVLTATISKGSAAPVTRVFDCTVWAEFTDQKKADLDANAISIGATTNVISNLTLPTSGTNGSTIAWQSDKTNVIANNGKVTRPEYGSGDATVTLTATVTNGTAKVTKTYTVTVKEKEFVLTLLGFEVANVTTAIGVAPVLPTTVTAKYNNNATRLMPVTWTAVDASKYAQAGTFNVEGTVNGTDVKATAVVRVNTLNVVSKFNSDKLTAGQKLTSSVDVTNKGQSSTSVLVIMTLNDQNNKMLSISYVTKAVAAGTTQNIAAELQLPSDVAGYKANLFVWDGTDIASTTMQPLTNAISLGNTVTGVAPAVPTALKGTAEASSITLTWDAVPGATGYDLESNGQVISNVTSPYVNSGLLFDSKQTYSIRAKNSSATSAWSLPYEISTVKPESGYNWTVKPFALTDVTLASSAFTGNRQRTINYLESLNPDTMLYNFRVTAGLDTKNAPSPEKDGWDGPTCKLRGHTTGHYLSAIAQAYAGAAAGSEEQKYFKDTIDYMMTELGKCQDALPNQSNDYGGNNNPGYLAGYPEKQFIRLEEFAGYGSGDNDIWAPYYTCHKIMAGLIDCYQLGDSQQALDIVTKMGDWVYGRLSKCTRAQLDKMWSIYIGGEYGGMNEVMAKLYDITGKKEYLTASKYFDNTALFNAMYSNNDTLNGKHANQHIPQFVGAIQEFDETNDPFYYTLADNFWSMVAEHRTYSNGGNGYGEMFKERDGIAAYIETGDKQAETCATYNMLKLTRELFFHKQDPKYMDYYEKGLYNDILASQDQEHEGHNILYFMPLNPGGQKGFGNGWTCCAGTGMENHTKYQDSIYFRSDDNTELYVNLYMPSTLDWKDKGIKVTQTTDWPSQQSTTLTVNGNGQFSMNLRVPYWATNGFTVKVNGVDQKVTATAGTYATVTRDWKDGDKVEISYPYSFRIERTPDDKSVISIFYGPILLIAQDERAEYINLTLDTTDLSKSIQPVAGKTMTFTTNGITLTPMYTVPGYTSYHTYFKTNN